MAEPGAGAADSFTVDTDNLYREESVTDLRAANIRVLVPIRADGSEDTTRERRYIGDTTLMTQMGPIPVQFPLDAGSLAEACALFPDGIRGAIERLNDRAREMAREEASRIVVPGQGGAGLGGGMGMPGMPGRGGGKLIID